MTTEETKSPNLMRPCQGYHCKGKGEATAELHSCPYASEIHNDDSESCDCCEKCEHECAMDI